MTKASDAAAMIVSRAPASRALFIGDSQHIYFDGLTPGQTYTVQVRALGGSTGQSDWSDPSTHMCM